MSHLTRDEPSQALMALDAMRERAERAERERDEARAEADRLRAAIDRHVAAQVHSYTPYSEPTYFALVSGVAGTYNTRAEAEAAYRKSHGFPGLTSAGLDHRGDATGGGGEG